MLWDLLETIIDDSPPADQKKLVSALLQCGCCARCVLRFLCEKQGHVYRKSIKALERGLQEFVAEDSKEVQSVNPPSTADVLPLMAASDPTEAQKVCVGCVGILQHHYSSKAFLDEVQEKVNKADYEYQTYFCALMIPVNILVREHSIWLMLKEILPSVYTDDKKEDLPNVKEVWKWCNGRELGSRLGTSFDQRSPFEIDMIFEHAVSDTECSFLSDLYPDTYTKRKDKKRLEVFTRANVAKSLSSTSDATFKKVYGSTPKPPSLPAVCSSLTCAHEATFFAGRYNKFSRSLSQTPWLIEGVRKGESSIEELISDPLKELVKATETKFSSSGREDMDVKMLGSGRPFLVEVVDPHRVLFTAQDMLKLQQTINESTGDIAVRDLQVVTREETSHLKEGEIDKIKHYSALCWCERELTEDLLKPLHKTEDLTLVQKTPIRVLHRRPLASRERVIHKMSTAILNEHYFVLNLATQAGTYIKEFVHGDFGRTTPNLCNMLNTRCDIIELNVTEVELAWPKHLEDDENT